MYLKSIVFLTVFAVGVTGMPRKASAETPKAKAFRLYQESEERYGQGKFQVAADLLEEAYRLDPVPTLLYNLARALESSGQLDAAADAYRKYLKKEKKPKDKNAILRRIENLDKQIEDRKALARERDEEMRRRRELEAQAKEGRDSVDLNARSGSEIATGTSLEQRSGPSVIPWVLIGAGASGLAAGAVLGLLASGSRADAEQTQEHKAATGLLEDARTFAFVSNMSYAVGGVAAAGGLIWLIVELSSDSGDAVSMQPIVSPSFVGSVFRF